MKNAQKPETIHLGKLIKNIQKGRYVIPDFQREFDWKPWDVCELIKSIFLDYYIGSLLLWDADKGSYKKLSCEPIFAFEGKLDPEYIVLDGQQRLTALHYALFQPNKAYKGRKSRIYFFIDITRWANGEIEGAFFYYPSTKYYSSIMESKKKQFEEKLVPLNLLSQGAYAIENWFNEFRKYWENEVEIAHEYEYEEEESPEDYIKESRKLIAASKDIALQIDELMDNYEISYVSLSSKLEIGKVCEIFTHINQKGVRLDTFDLLNAIMRPKEIFLKDLYRKASKILHDNDYPGFEMKTYLMMVMSIMKQNYCSPKYLYYLVPQEKKTIKTADGGKEEIVLIEHKEAFIDLWNKAVEVVDKTLSSLKNPRDFGAISSKFLPYPSIIPCLAAIKSYVEASDLKNKVTIHSKIRKWYWSAIFQKRYSSSAESTSAKDYMDLKKWFIDDDNELESYTEFVASFRDLDLHKETKAGSAIYKAIFNLFILKEAKDWKSFELPEYHNLDDHHIVPKSWGKQMKLGSEINTILNRTPLSDITNRKVIKDQLPNVYIKHIIESNDEEKVYEIFQSHLISRKALDILLRDPFTVDDYKAFILERKESILLEIEHTLIKEKLDIPENLKELNSDIELVELALRAEIKEKCNLVEVSDIKNKIPNHFLPKLTNRIDKEVRKNPALKVKQESDVDFWIQFLDLQELNDIIRSKANWSFFEPLFSTKDKVTSEFNDVANLRNAIRHSREADQITRMKGEASILWFKQQLNI